MTAKKTHLQVVREGNPGHRPLPENVALPPASFDEPDWSLHYFPRIRVPAKPRPPRRRKAEDAEDWTYRRAQHETKLREWEQAKLNAEMATFCQGQASAAWQMVVPIMLPAVGLGDADHSTVVDYCVCVARLMWCERRLTIEGPVIDGRRGPAKNQLTTVANQYRTQLKTYIRELGLSPHARTGMPGRSGPDDEDDPFD